MSSINLGRIKFIWKGGYDTNTNYTPDDVIEANGSTFVCTTETTGNFNPAHWEVMALGADLSQIANAPGDIFTFDGTSFTKVTAPNYKAVLTTDGNGNLNWKRATYTVGQIKATYTDSRGEYNGIVTPLNTSITPTASDSRIQINVHLFGEMHWDRYIRMQYRVNGGSWNWVRNSNSWVTPSYDNNTDSTPQAKHWTIYHDPNTTGTVEYGVHTNNTFDLNRAWNNGGEYGYSWMEITEHQPI